MPTNRTPIRRQRHPLSWEQEMSLELGEDERRRAFATDQSRRDAWERNRDYLMARCHDGQRPAAWWEFDAAIRRPREREYEAAALWEAELLFPEEAAMLETRWREKFDRANGPDWIGYCIGHAKPGDRFATWLKGEEGRRAYYKWAGIPKALVARWTKQRAKTIRRLEKLPSEQPPA